MNTSVFKSAAGKKAVLRVYDSLLEKWPVRFEEITLGTRCGDTFVIACGDKSLPPLILLHGSSSNSAMWIGDISDYSKYFRVYAADLPGESGKSCDIRPDLKTSACADWMKDVFSGTRHRKSVLCRHLARRMGKPEVCERVSRHDGEPRTFMPFGYRTAESLRYAFYAAP